eukprot:COSAG04_NODE_640_length_11672_cov_32.635358_6_plen_98_part_00
MTDCVWRIGRRPDEDWSGGQRRQPALDRLAGRKVACRSPAVVTPTRPACCALYKCLGVLDGKKRLCVTDVWKRLRVSFLVQKLWDVQSSPRSEQQAV